MLKEVFSSLVSNYSSNQQQIDALWDAIQKKHTHKNRYYHNLTHLENIYIQLQKIKHYAIDWDILLFAMFYHDYVYNPVKKDNENQSAIIATKILSSLSINQHRITRCHDIILATKGHHQSSNSDVNYFTDADLSILGSSWNTYQIYLENVRKEYKYYPDFIYNKGRIKVLEQFIEMPRIFKTDYFYNQLEEQAKYNLQKEINILSK